MGAGVLDNVEGVDLLGHDPVEGLIMALGAFQVRAGAIGVVYADIIVPH